MITWLQKHIYIVIAYIVIVALLVGTKLYFRVQELNRNDTRSQPISITINDIYTDEKDVPVFWELTDDQQFVYINTTIKNNKSEIYEFSPISSISLYSVEEQIMYEVSGAPYAKDALGGPIQPKQTVLGSIPFTVSKGHKEYIMYIQPYGSDAQLQWFYVTL